MRNKNLKALLMIFASILAVNYIFNNYTINILFPLLKALYLIGALFVIGYFLSKIRHTSHGSPLEFIGKGMVFSCFYFYFFSFIKKLNHFSITLYLLIPLVLLAIIIKDRSERTELFSNIKNFLKRHPFEYLIFLFPFIYASLPSTFYDSLVYNLGIPNLYLQNNGFIEAPQMMFSNMFIFYEISLIPAVFLGDFVPRLFHFFIGTIFILSIADFGTEVFEIGKRKILLITIVTLPLTMFLITSVKADLITALFIFLGVKKYYDNAPVYSAIFWGFAVGVKVYSSIALIIFFLLMILKNRKPDFKKHLIIALVIILVILPLVIKNLLLIGNPFFPFFPQYFHNEFWDSSRYLLVRSEVGTHYHSIIDFLTAPYSFSFELQGAGGMVGPIFLLFLPFLIFYKIRRKFILFFALALLFIGPFFGEAFRYIYVVFVLLSIFVALSYELVNNKLLKIAFVIVIFINFTYAFTTLESIYSARLIYFNKLNIDEYKSHFFQTYKAFSTINNITEKTAKILVAGEARGYYLKRPYMLSSAHDYSIFKKYLSTSDSEMQFLNKIKGDGYDYIIFNLSEFRRLQGYKRLTGKEEKKLFKFLMQIKPFRQEGPIYIYKL